MAFLVRLYRILPLLAVLAVVAAIVYLVVSFRSSPNRAKELMTKMFTWICGVLTILFGLAALYAIGESNAAVAELFGSFAATTLIGLLVTRWCRHVFVRHHPNYGSKTTADAEVINPKPWWWPFGGPKEKGPFDDWPFGPFDRR